MNLYDLSLKEVADKIKNKQVTIKEILDSVYKRIEEVEESLDAFITLTKAEAYKRGEASAKASALR